MRIDTIGIAVECLLVCFFVSKFIVNLHQQYRYCKKPTLTEKQYDYANAKQ